MSKWKCEICGVEFENFHAQGFDNKIYCPLCYFKRENQELKKQLEEINNFINKANFANIEQLMLDYCAKTEEQKEFIDWLENEIENCKYGEENYADGDDMSYYNENELRKEILSKYKEIIGEKR